MIETSSALITSYRDSQGMHAIARVDQTMSGCGVQIRLVNSRPYGVFWLCRRKDDSQNDYILMLPSVRWEQDARDAGFELIQKLNQRTP